MYNNNYSMDNMNNYGNTNYNNENFKSNNKKKRSRIFIACLFAFYSLCLVFIIIGIVFWWNNKETFYLTADEISMITNDKYQIGLYGKTESKKNSSYKYTSTNPDIVTVDENGVIHSVSEGEAEIIVKSKYSSKSNIIKVNVEGDSIYSVEFGNDKLNMDLEEKIELKPIVNGDPNFKADLVWKVEDSRFVTVNSKGVITGRNPGTTYLTVTVRNTKISSKLKIRVSSKKAVKPIPEQISNSNKNRIITEDTTDEEEENINSYVGVVNIDAYIKTPKVKVGSITKVNYNITPIDATNKKVSWASSDENIAVVDGNGVVRALSPGTVDISVKTQDGNKTSFVTLEVVSDGKSKPVIQLNKTQTTIRIGQSETLSAIVNPSDTKVIWISSNPKIATVDSNGTVSGKKEGNVIISVRTIDGKVVSKCKVSVTNNDVQVTGITINKSKINLKKGASAQLKVSIMPRNATNQVITFASNNTKVAVVDSKGKITAVGNGKAMITARSNNGKTAQCLVIVSTVKIKSIIVKKSSIQVAKGKKFKIATSVSPKSANNKALKYSTKNRKIATVDQNGNVKAVGIGTTTIVIKALDGSGKVAKVKVVVAPKISIINVKKSKYKAYYKNIENYLTTKKSKHMQNFAIQNLGKSNEIIYLSGVTAGNTEDPMTSETKANLSRTLVAKIPKSTIKSGSKKRNIMYLKNTGHGQSFDIETNGILWTNAKAVEPYYSSDRWWGQHKGAMRISFKSNSKNSRLAPLAIVYPKDSSTGKPYTGVDISVDEVNDLLAARSGKKVIVYKLSAAKKSKLVKLYEFNVNNTDTYRQGEDIFGGYYYLLLGSAGDKMKLEVYDMLGSLKYSKSFYVASKSATKKYEIEPEGLKIYGKRIFIGLTHDKAKTGVLFDIGYFK